MRKLDLRDLDVEAQVIDETTGQEATVWIPVKARAGLVGLLFADPQLPFEEALARHDLALRIRKHENHDLLLEEADFQRITRAIDTFRGFNQYTVLLAVRAKTTPIVEVAERRIEAVK